ncbi:penicillin acylase family protein [Niveispirillum sp. SYP-B3756]|uniref:penicillin acylase family protein n=1 Tax=Niveispirillum sp. SYP-B3756 TaxID=2662178 RepID=UPI00156758E1|nr:penicillin acylase family protein [Niveispirillum sp. SYP-B3756]
MGGRRGVARRLGRVLGYGVAGIAGIVAVAAAGVGWTLYASRPALDGTRPVPGLEGPVSIARDSQGVPLVEARSRADLARALGFLHGQERFFQMDLIRRASAGELSALLGPIGPVVEIDKTRRLHRFRHRAGQIIATMDAGERALLEAYAEGVNAGLDALGARPFEYALLLASPKPWTAEDSILAAFAMYLDLQDGGTAGQDRARAAAQDRLGPELTEFLFPRGTPLDSALDGSQLPEPPMPATLPVGLASAPPAKAALLAPLLSPGSAFGSNGWAVGGGLTGTGAGLLANDMHLGLSIPGTWYRARLKMAGGTEPDLDVTGATLPGTPLVVAGSNGRIAWGYTNSYIDTADLVVLDPVEGAADQYQTPDGPRALTRVTEQICPAWADCQTLEVEESIWGPVVGRDGQGRRLSVRWTAHDPDAINLHGLLGLERARSVADAINIAHIARQPQQNLVVTDSAGNVAWTVIGAVPHRFGQDGRLPTSWADGRRGWVGMVSPDQIPTILNPDDQRIWTANARIVGGAAYALLGDGGYDMGARQGQIRDGLLARNQFTPKDMLAIQLDDRGGVLDFWQGQMLAALGRHQDDPALAALVGPVQNWGGRAVPDSVGYRLVREFRQGVAQRLYGAYLGLTEKPSRREMARQMEAPLRRLLEQRPAALVPPGYADWDGLLAAVLTGLAGDVTQAGGLDAYTWGARNKAGIGHPLARILPPLAWLTDPPDVPVPGDALQPRAQAPGFGASERFGVSPGREKEGYFHMPGSQSGNPLSPYYLAGHQDWVMGNPTPFLPGAARWTLTLRPEN